MLIYKNLVRNEVQLLLENDLVLIDIPDNNVVPFFTDTSHYSSIKVAQHYEALFQEISIHSSKNIDLSFWLGIL